MMAMEPPGERVVIGGRRGEALVLRNPVMAAAGCCGSGGEYVREPWLRQAAAVVTQTLALTPRRSRARERVAEAPAGLLYVADPLCPGLREVLARAAQAWRSAGVPIVVSITATTPAEYADAAAELDGVPGVAGLELNLAGTISPHPRAAPPATAYAAVEAVAAASTLPLLVKLAPGSDTGDVAMAAADAGADALVVAHGWPATAADVRPRDGAFEETAEWLLAGPAIRPQTLRLVAQVTGEVDVPIIGCGGVDSAAAVRAYLSAGACAVQVGAALLRDPFILGDIVRGLAPDSGET
jgi:dihydroorotate dehydrogenase (NAD+) catalytic subunit